MTNTKPQAMTRSQMIRALSDYWGPFLGGDVLVVTWDDLKVAALERMFNDTFVEED